MMQFVVQYLADQTKRTANQFFKIPPNQPTCYYVFCRGTKHILYNTPNAPSLLKVNLGGVNRQFEG